MCHTDITKQLIATKKTNILDLFTGEGGCSSWVEFLLTSDMKYSKLIHLVMDSLSCCKADVHSQRFTIGEGEEPNQYAQISARSERSFTGYMMADEIVARILDNPYYGYEKEENNHEINPAMSLPIYTSINSGNLREEKIYASKSKYDISLLCQEVSNRCLNRKLILTDLDDGITKILGKDHLADVAEEYEKDRALRRKAEEQRKEQFTPFNESNIVYLDGFITHTPYSTPYERFCYLLAKAENQRTKQYLMKLVASAHDDELLRDELYKLMTEILSLSENANVSIVRPLLCQLYLELYHTFKPVLEKDESGKLLFEFDDVFYYIIGRYPDEDTKRKYNESVRKTIPTPLYVTSPSENSEQHPPQPSDIENERITKFKKEVNRYGFYQMEKVEALDTEEKMEKLVLLIFDRAQHEQPFGYAAAMLKYLGFEEQFKQHYKGQFKVRYYDRWCEINVMNFSEEKASGNAFKHYRQSVGFNPDDRTKDNYNRLGWKYYNGIVQKDYEDILKG